MSKPDPVKAARDAAEAIRRLNHATSSRRDPVPAPQISTITHELYTVANRLPQAWSSSAHS